MPRGNELRQSLKDILSDNRSGSTEIALKVLDFYSSLSTGEEKFVERACNEIIGFHAGMGIVRNVASELQSQFAKEPETIGETVGKLRKRIAEESSAAIKNANSAIPPGSVLCTISKSSMVWKSILSNRERISEVFVLESRPLLEGRVLAKALSKEAIPYTLVVDSALGIVSKYCDIALLGSDSVLGDLSLVHKIGTYPLSLAMNAAGKKVVSLTTELKFERSFNQSNYPEFKTHPGGEIAPADIRSRNVYFDITPSSLISLYVSNKGSIEPGCTKAL